LSEEIFDALYDHTQGVTDFLVKLLVLSQRYAIQSGSEQVTVETLMLISNTKMQILKPALSALRSRDPKWMRQFEDLLPLDDQLTDMLAFDSSSRLDRLTLLRSVSSRNSSAISPASTSEALASVGRPALPAAFAVTETSEARAISNNEDPLSALQAAGWMNNDLFEFSSLYRKE
jgi:hypothetical protein